MHGGKNPAFWELPAIKFQIVFDKFFRGSAGKPNRSAKAVPERYALLNGTCYERESKP